MKKYNMGLKRTEILFFVSFSGEIFLVQHDDPHQISVNLRPIWQFCYDIALCWRFLIGEELITIVLL